MDKEKKPKGTKQSSEKETVVINPPEKRAPVNESFYKILRERWISQKARMVVEAKANLNGIPVEILETVYIRGAITTPPKHLTIEQHALNRVNSFIALGEAFDLDIDLVPLEEKVGIKGTGGGARPHIKTETNPYNGEKIYHVVDAKGRTVHSTNDQDQAKQHLARNYNRLFQEEKGVELDPAKREVGTSSLVKTYRDATPGQEDADIAEAKKMKGEDPCWDGYEMVGTKKKGGKEVPNCVPKEEVELGEVSDATLQSYRDKAKDSAKDLTAQGKHDKAWKRTMGDMRAGTKQLKRTVAGIKSAVRKLKTEEVNEMFMEAVSRNDLSKSATGRVYSVQFMYRGMNKALQMYFPSLTRPTADVINMQLGKSYQGAQLKRYDAIERFTKDPLLVVREDIELAEISDKLKNKYLQKAIDQHGHADFAARQTQNPEEKKEMEKIRAKRAKGISKALGEESDGKKLNKPFRTPGGPKKFSVYVKSEKGNVKKVNFGDPNMEIKRDDPDRRKAYRSRHNCDNPGPKTKANYWSCRNWGSKAVGK